MSPLDPSPWPRRMAWTLLVGTLVVLLAGGFVTTYRVGMAVPDWPTTFGRNMFTYPLEEMLANFGVGLEHSHRLLGAAIGLLTVFMFVASFASTRKGVRILAGAALVLVCIQGLIGGLRVIANDSDLAFLHGATAQIYYGLVGALFVVTSRAWIEAEQRPCKQARGMRRVAVVAIPLVYAQIVLGAWLRHSGLPMALGLHVVFALVTVGVLMAVIAKLRVTAEQGEAGGHDRSALLRLRSLLLVLVVAQFLLGIVTTAAIFLWSGGFEGRVAVSEAISATLHVAVGASLFAATIGAALWSFRLVGTRPQTASSAANALGAAEASA